MAKVIRQDKSPSMASVPRRIPEPMSLPMAWIQMMSAELSSRLDAVTRHTQHMLT